MHCITVMFPEVFFPNTLPLILEWKLFKQGIMAQTKNNTQKKGNKEITLSFTYSLTHTWTVYMAESLEFIQDVCIL